MPERTIRQTTCATCNGKGKIASPGKKICTKCKGQGWTLAKSANATLCSSCNGDGEVATTATCIDCEGRGFQVSIVELHYGRQVCGNCEGKGLIPQKCSVCGGSGYKWFMKQSFTSPHKVGCVPCAGTGIVSRPACRACHGKGYTLVPVEKEVKARRTTK
jgi:DnaJ-class molecular chaperone